MLQLVSRQRHFFLFLLLLWWLLLLFFIRRSPTTISAISSGSDESQDTHGAELDSIDKKQAELERELRSKFGFGEDELESVEETRRVLYENYKLMRMKASNGSKFEKPRLIPLTFDDPDSYRGPIVQGWPPYKSRTMTDYIKANSSLDSDFILKPVNRVKVKLKLLVVVHSAPGSFSMRQGIRRTWGHKIYALQRHKALVLFLLGRSKPPETEQKVRREAEEHDDILQANFIDHYNNLTLKSMYSLKFFLRHNWEVGSPKFLLKTDDDSYLNLKALWRSLEAQRLNNNFILGNIMGLPGTKANNLPVQVPRGRRLAKYTLKWWCPKYMFNGLEYPAAASGCGYGMDRTAANCLFAKLLGLPFFHLEDVFITGFGGQACGTQLIHHAGFKFTGSTLKEVGPNEVLIHYVDNVAKSHVHKILLFDELKTRYLNFATRLRQNQSEASAIFAAIPTELTSETEEG